MPSTTLSAHTYPSKRNPVLITDVYGLLLAITIIGYKSLSLFSLLFNLLLIAFFTHLFLSTKYTVKEGMLIVQSGLFYKKTIDISAIRKISESYSWWSTPAFIAHLLHVNPAIVVADQGGR